MVYILTVVVTAFLIIEEEITIFGHSITHLNLLIMDDSFIETQNCETGFYRFRIGYICTEGRLS